MANKKQQDYINDMSFKTVDAYDPLVTQKQIEQNDKLLNSQQRKSQNKTSSSSSKEKDYTADFAKLGKQYEKENLKTKFDLKKKTNGVTDEEYAKIKQELQPKIVHDDRMSFDTNRKKQETVFFDYIDKYSKDNKLTSSQKKKLTESLKNDFKNDNVFTKTENERRREQLKEFFGNSETAVKVADIVSNVGTFATVKGVNALTNKLKTEDHSTAAAIYGFSNVFPKSAVSSSEEITGNTLKSAAKVIAEIEGESNALKDFPVNEYYKNDITDYSLDPIQAQRQASADSDFLAKRRLKQVKDKELKELVDNKQYDKIVLSAVKTLPKDATDEDIKNRILEYGAKYFEGNARSIEKSGIDKLGDKIKEKGEKTREELVKENKEFYVNYNKFKQENQKELGEFVGTINSIYGSSYGFGDTAGQVVGSVAPMAALQLIPYLGQYLSVAAGVSMSASDQATNVVENILKTDFDKLEIPDQIKLAALQASGGDKEKAKIYIADLAHNVALTDPKTLAIAAAEPIVGAGKAARGLSKAARGIPSSNLTYNSALGAAKNLATTTAKNMVGEGIQEAAEQANSNILSAKFGTGTAWNEGVLESAASALIPIGGSRGRRATNYSDSTELAIVENNQQNSGVEVDDENIDRSKYDVFVDIDSGEVIKYPKGEPENSVIEPHVANDIQVDVEESKQLYKQYSEQGEILYDGVTEESYDAANKDVENMIRTSMVEDNTLDDLIFDSSIDQSNINDVIKSLHSGEYDDNLSVTLGLAIDKLSSNEGIFSNKGRQNFMNTSAFEDANGKKIDFVQNHIENFEDFLHSKANLSTAFPSKEQLAATNLLVNNLFNDIVTSGYDAKTVKDSLAFIDEIEDLNKKQKEATKESLISVSRFARDINYFYKRPEVEANNNVDISGDIDIQQSSPSYGAVNVNDEVSNDGVVDYGYSGNSSENVVTDEQVNNDTDEELDYYDDYVDNYNDSIDEEENGIVEEQTSNDNKTLHSKRKTATISDGIKTLNGKLSIKAKRFLTNLINEEINSQDNGMYYQTLTNTIFVRDNRSMKERALEIDRIVNILHEKGHALYEKMIDELEQYLPDLVNHMLEKYPYAKRVATLYADVYGTKDKTRLLNELFVELNAISHLNEEDLKIYLEYKYGEETLELSFKDFGENRVDFSAFLSNIKSFVKEVYESIKAFIKRDYDLTLNDEQCESIMRDFNVRLDNEDIAIIYFTKSANANDAKITEVVNANVANADVNNMILNNNDTEVKFESKTKTTAKTAASDAAIKVLKNKLFDGKDSDKKTEKYNVWAKKIDEDNTIMTFSQWVKFNELDSRKKKIILDNVLVRTNKDGSKEPLTVFIADGVDNVAISNTRRVASFNNEFVKNLSTKASYIFSEGKRPKVVIRGGCFNKSVNDVVKSKTEWHNEKTKKMYEKEIVPWFKVEDVDASVLDILKDYKEDDIVFAHNLMLASGKDNVSFNANLTAYAADSKRFIKDLADILKKFESDEEKANKIFSIIKNNSTKKADNSAKVELKIENFGYTVVNVDSNDNVKDKLIAFLAHKASKNKISFTWLTVKVKNAFGERDSKDRNILHLADESILELEESINKYFNLAQGTIKLTEKDLISLYHENDKVNGDTIIVSDNNDGIITLSHNIDNIAVKEQGEVEHIEPDVLTENSELIFEDNSAENTFISLVNWARKKYEKYYPARRAKQVFPLHYSQASVKKVIIIGSLYDYAASRNISSENINSIITDEIKFDEFIEHLKNNIAAINKNFYNNSLFDVSLDFDEIIRSIGNTTNFRDSLIAYINDTTNKERTENKNRNVYKSISLKVKTLADNTKTIIADKTMKDQIITDILISRSKSADIDEFRKEYEEKDINFVAAIINNNLDITDVNNNTVVSNKELKSAILNDKELSKLVTEEEREALENTENNFVVLQDKSFIENNSPKALYLTEISDIYTTKPNNNNVAFIKPDKIKVIQANAKSISTEDIGLFSKLTDKQVLNISDIKELLDKRNKSYEGKIDCIIVNDSISAESFVITSGSVTTTISQSQLFALQKTGEIRYFYDNEPTNKKIRNAVLENLSVISNVITDSSRKIRDALYSLYENNKLVSDITNYIMRNNEFNLYTAIESAVSNIYDYYKYNVVEQLRQRFDIDKIRASDLNAMNKIASAFENTFNQKFSNKEVNEIFQFGNLADRSLELVSLSQANDLVKTGISTSKLVEYFGNVKQIQDVLLKNKKNHIALSSSRFLDERLADKLSFISTDNSVLYNLSSSNVINYSIARNILNNTKDEFVIANIISNNKLSKNDLAKLFKEFSIMNNTNFLPLIEAKLSGNNTDIASIELDTYVSTETLNITGNKTDKKANNIKHEDKLAAVIEEDDKINDKTDIRKVFDLTQKAAAYGGNEYTVNKSKERIDKYVKKLIAEGRTTVRSIKQATDIHGAPFNDGEYIDNVAKRNGVYKSKSKQNRYEKTSDDEAFLEALRNTNEREKFSPIDKSDRFEDILNLFDKQKDKGIISWLKKIKEDILEKTQYNLAKTLVNSKKDMTDMLYKIYRAHPELDKFISAAEYSMHAIDPKRKAFISHFNKDFKDISKILNQISIESNVDQTDLFHTVGMYVTAKRAGKETKRLIEVLRKHQSKLQNDFENLDVLSRDYKSKAFEISKEIKETEKEIDNMIKAYYSNDEAAASKVGGGLTKKMADAIVAEAEKRYDVSKLKYVENKLFEINGKNLVERLINKRINVDRFMNILGSESPIIKKKANRIREIQSLLDTNVRDNEHLFEEYNKLYSDLVEEAIKLEYVPLTGFLDLDLDDSKFSIRAYRQSADKQMNNRDKASSGRRSIAESAINTTMSAVLSTANYVGQHDLGIDLLKIFNKLSKKERDELGVHIKDVTLDGVPEESLLVTHDGKQIAISFDDTRILSGFRNDSSSIMVNWMRGVTGKLSALYTSLNIEFALVQYIRDIFEKGSVLNGFDIYDKNGNKLDSYEIFKQVTLRGLDPIRRINYLRKAFKYVSGSSRLNEKDKSIMRFIERKGGYQFQSDEIYGVHTRSKLNFFDKKHHTKWGKAKYAFAKFVEVWNSAFDVATNTMLFDTLLEAGLDSKQAAELTLATMNFSKKGTATKGISAIYAFANPAFQGGDLMISSIYDFKRQEFRKNGIKHLAMLTASYAALYSIALMIYSFADDDDDDESNKIAELNGNVKNTSLQLFVGNGKYVKIPIAYGSHRIAANTAMGLIDYTLGYSSLAESAYRVLDDGIIDNITPITPPPKFFDNPAKALTQTFSPVWAKPAVNVAINRNDFGNKIVYNDFDDNKKYNWEKAHISVAPFWVETAKFAQENFGIDVHPANIKQLVSGYGGSAVTQFTKRSFENDYAIERGKEISSSTSQFVRNINIDIKNQRIGDLYTFSDKQAKVYKRVLHDESYYDSLSAKEQELLDIYLEYNKDMSKLNAQKAQITKKYGKDLEKYSALDDIKVDVQMQYWKLIKDTEK